LTITAAVFSVVTDAALPIERSSITDLTPVCGYPLTEVGLWWRRIARVRVQYGSNVLRLIPQSDDPIAEFSVIGAVKIRVIQVMVEIYDRLGENVTDHSRSYSWKIAHKCQIYFWAMVSRVR
jgi:hypothetical protein